jgi:hypothetical protein
MNFCQVNSPLFPVILVIEQLTFGLVDGGAVIRCSVPNTLMFPGFVDGAGWKFPAPPGLSCRFIRIGIIEFLDLFPNRHHWRPAIACRIDAAQVALLSGGRLDLVSLNFDQRDAVLFALVVVMSLPNIFGSCDIDIEPSGLPRSGGFFHIVPRFT